jgi:hypothetical protein
MEKIRGLRVKTRSEFWSSDLEGHMAIDWPVREFIFRENGKGVSVLSKWKKVREPLVTIRRLKARIPELVIHR